MGADKIKASHSALTGAAHKFDQQVQTLESILSQLTNTVSELQGEWAGDATESFTNAMGDWNKSVAQMNQTLETISKNVKQGADLYVAVDSDIAKGFRR